VTFRATYAARFALLAGVLAGTPAIAAPPHAPAPRHQLAEAAKDPLQRGLIAAQQQDWKLAIRYLTDAQKADPDAPEILFNLGLASSKLPGYELRSMAWFQAYLLADPDAANASAVRSQLFETEIAFESKVGKILEQLEGIAAVGLHPIPEAGIAHNLVIAHHLIGDSAGADRIIAAKDLHVASWEQEFSANLPAGKDRREYLIGFGLNGLQLDPEKKLDDTQLDDFVREHGLRMTTPPTVKGELTEAVEQETKVFVALDEESSQIIELARAYRIIRGP
jgi:tetratricopeptide (TPR) repeat protein